METYNYYRSAPDENLILSEKYSYIYDPERNLESRLLYVWDNIQQIFINTEKRIYMASMNGQLVTEVGYTYGNSVWVPNDSTQNAYDSAGHIIEQKKYIWNNAINAWRNSFWNINQYDANNNVILLESYLWNMLTGAWGGTNKMVYLYDSNNNRLLYEQYRWNTNTSTWYISTKYINNYDERNNEIFREYYGWNNSLNTLLGTEKWEATYNEFDKLASYVRYRWMQASSIWENFSRTENTYDEHGDLVINSLFEWNSNTSEWVENSRIINRYDEQMRIIRTEYYYLNRVTSEIVLNQYTISYYTNMRVSETSLSFPSAGGKKIIYIVSNGSWTIESTVNWLTISPLTGNGNGEIHIIATENESVEARNAILETQSSSPFLAIHTIGVNQEAESTPPLTYYDVVIHPAEGAETYPKPGIYRTEEGTSFMINIYVNKEYDTSEIALQINGVIYKPNRFYWGFSFTIPEVLENKEVEIIGLKLIPPVGNESMNDEFQIYSSENMLHILSPYSTKLLVYTISGEYYLQKNIMTGHNTINLPTGVYLVIIDNKSYKVFIK